MKTDSRLGTVHLTKSAIAATEKLLRGFRRLETVVYWFGISTERGAIVTSVVRPRQRRTSGSFEVDVGSNADIAILSCDFDITLLAQVHSHPGDFVGHSYGDDLGVPFTFKGFLSIIVPNYGCGGMLPLERCGIHTFHDQFVRLTEEQIQKTFKIVPDVIDLI